MERHVNPEDPDLYALGALDGQDKQDLEAHVRSCAACAQELAAARQRVMLLGLAASPVRPSPAVKARLMEKVRAEEGSRSARPVVEPPARRRRFSLLVPLLGACAIFFAMLAGWLWQRDLRDANRIAFLQSRLAQTEAQSREIAHAAEETDHLLGMPGTMRAALNRMPGMTAGRVGVLYNAKMGMVAFAGWLPAAPPDKSYQLWLVPMKGAPMSLRVFSAGEWNGTMMTHVPPGMEAKAFAVTMEPAGGMPQPTGPKVLVGVPS
ncbi:MAG TPA: anti-sigma factor [Acidobacteriaceae bacterium]|jgi:anti-sigma-K factor RskA|nr:anti-sigma factor [Acidobacteriaceae bacterium]